MGRRYTWAMRGECPVPKCEHRDDYTLVWHLKDHARHTRPMVMRWQRSYAGDRWLAWVFTEQVK